MAPLLPLLSRMQARSALTSLGTPVYIQTFRRRYAQGSSSSKSDGDKSEPARDGGPPEDPAVNYPIPSNKATPTLRDGRQSPIADFEGNLKEDLPEDVKRHNEEMEHRYDRPYNHIGDKGKVERTWQND
ncbi:hypothetical protein N7462_009453 [Penicillium macrosclerotiorum]|uniref:uncharacterized protein n=1 Tax=Penicillium macrosclerotiorum TaxID=303699 RepID=UPI002548989C|nr:uncharacterized protein N7462_009453 [Penicillium macrosclerotiorum]KAJ5674014.1 hypothetical protein N7462_009453 [Penicillium macrosclerotiorum]